jgi:hypothetical protein
MAWCSHLLSLGLVRVLLSLVGVLPDEEVIGLEHDPELAHCIVEKAGVRKREREMPIRGRHSKTPREQQTSEQTGKSSREGAPSCTRSHVHFNSFSALCTPDCGSSKEPGWAIEHLHANNNTPAEIRVRDDGTLRADMK